MAGCLQHVRLCVKDIQRLTAFQLTKRNFTCSFKKLRTASHQHLPHHSYHSLWKPTGLLQGRYAVYGVAFHRNQTTTPDSVPGVSRSYIPEAPPLPEVPPTILENLNALGEPSIQSLGLGNWTPAGLVQNGLELLHVGFDIPWWAAIITGTLVIRLLMFPLVVHAQRNTARVRNNAPQTQILQQRVSDARMRGDQLGAARAARDMMDFMQRTNTNPAKIALVPLAQVPIFLSVFTGLRGMANLPVESMKTGGMFWFTDLTVPDEFYVMPIVASATFLLTIELGADGVSTTSMTHTVKWFLRSMSVFMLLFTSNFPAAMLCYWCSSNMISLLQMLIFKIPSVRQYFKIPPIIHHDMSSVPRPKGFLEGFREAIDNAKITAEMKDRQRVDMMRFKKAGEGPVPKTYAYDPSKIKTIKPSKVSNVKRSRPESK